MQTVNYNISINKELDSIVSKKMKEGRYGNRSEFFRDLLRRSFVFENNLDIELVPQGTKEHKEMMQIYKKGEFISWGDVKKDLKK